MAPIQNILNGWWWFGECFIEWFWCMTHPDDSGGDFFCYICSDYCAYLEDTSGGDFDR